MNTKNKVSTIFIIAGFFYCGFAVARLSVVFPIPLGLALPALLVGILAVAWALPRALSTTAAVAKAENFPVPVAIGLVVTWLLCLVSSTVVVCLTSALALPKFITILLAIGSALLTLGMLIQNTPKKLGVLFMKLG